MRATARRSPRCSRSGSGAALARNPADAGDLDGLSPSRGPALGFRAPAGDSCYTGLVPPEEKPELVVTDALDGARLDKATVALAEGTLSRAKVKRAIDAGEVRVNGRRRPKGALVAKGDRITLEERRELERRRRAAVPDPATPLNVRFESSAVVVVDKPAGQPTAPLRAGEIGTLANALLARYPELAGIGYSPREPGLVHRLDTDTSGLVVVARTAAAFETFKSALKEGRITKRYLLVCASAGIADDGTIAFPIASHPKDQRRVLACVHPRDVMRYAPRPASTRCVPGEVRGAAEWKIRPRRGRGVVRALRHQIRAHFAAIEHPLVGDVLYGGDPGGSRASRATRCTRRRVAFARMVAGTRRCASTSSVRRCPRSLAALEW